MHDMSPKSSPALLYNVGYCKFVPLEYMALVLGVSDGIIRSMCITYSLKAGSEGCMSVGGLLHAILPYGILYWFIFY